MLSPHSVPMKGWFQDLLRIQTSDAQVPSVKWHRTFPMVQWWRLQAPSTGDSGSISGRGTEIPHAKLQTKRESIKKKKWRSKTGRLCPRFPHLGRRRADCGSNVTCWHLAKVSLTVADVVRPWHSACPGHLILVIEGTFHQPALFSMFSVLCFLQSGG